MSVHQAHRTPSTILRILFSVMTDCVWRKPDVEPAGTKLTPLRATLTPFAPAVDPNLSSHLVDHSPFEEELDLLKARRQMFMKDCRNRRRSESFLADSGSDRAAAIVKHFMIVSMKELELHVASRPCYCCIAVLTSMHFRMRSNRSNDAV